ncbi:MAG: cytochrome b N-terminal domain-containing protein [Chloroflexota bacterium]
MNLFSRRVVFICLTILTLVVAVSLAATSSGQATPQYQNAGPPDKMEQPHGGFEQVRELLTSLPVKTLAEETPNTLPPPPKTDPCLHCHIKGEEKGMWTPLARWVIFGTAGLFLVFGIVRSAVIWKSRSPWKPMASRVAQWIEERYQLSDPLSKILKKPVPEWQRHWWYCLGGLTAFFFMVQGITGIMLAFYYKPTPEAAYSSIQFIENEVRLGAAIRMIHHWSANGMIVMAIAHMLRVFIMGAYKPPRELNWVSGVILLLTTLAFGFTGYLLPWDQRAFWATTVGTEIAGSWPVVGELALVFLRVGWDINALTLSRFYALHVLVLPVITIGTMGLHFLMIRRLGIMKPL